jgi:predicted amidohydrolase YtcJ
MKGKTRRQPGPAVCGGLCGSEWELLVGQEARLGTLAEGKVADFVILDGNPLADIRQIRQVEVVLREGQIVWKK